MSGPDVTAVTDFVETEAELLDDRRFHEWLDLLSDDAVYWVPLSPEQSDPLEGPSHIFETRDALTARVLRLEDPHSTPLQPYARCSRILGRVRVDDCGPGDPAIEARANFHLVEAVSRHDAEDSTRTFAGTIRWILVKTDQGIRIRRKRIDLVNSERGLFGISVLL